MSPFRTATELTLKQSAHSAASRLANAAEMLVDVAEKSTLDHLLGAHRRHSREHHARLRQLGIGEATYCRSRSRSPLLVERDCLLLRAAGELPGMLGVHLVDHLTREVWQCLAGGDRLDDVSYRLVAAGDVVRRRSDRPLLGGFPRRCSSHPFTAGYRTARVTSVTRVRCARSGGARDEERVSPIERRAKGDLISGAQTLDSLERRGL